MNLYQRATELTDELIRHRRFFHQHAETGLNTPHAVNYVMDQLTGYGLHPQRCGHGVTATIGTGGKVLLLRADMDALPMKEESGEPFACVTGKAAHTCGHDLHAAMLLVAARLLKERESTLNGTVKLMFQSGEEVFLGAKDMLDSGVLEQPKVDAALAYHVGPGKLPLGLFMFNDNGVMMASVDTFRIRIQGKGAHGAYPHNAIDPINIGVHIYLALQELMAREVDPALTCVLTMGRFSAGTAPNIIPDTAELEGSIRTNDPDARALMVRRLQEIVPLVAQTYLGEAQVELTVGVPPLICDKDVTQAMVRYMKELNIPGCQEYPGITSSASEDFALIAEAVPSAYMYLSSGFLDERGNFGSHHPKVRFNEEVLPIGASCMAHCALRWLDEHR